MSLPRDTEQTDIPTKCHNPCLEHAGLDEPLFVLRAQDVTAPIVVRLWAGLVQVARQAQTEGRSVLQALDNCEGILAGMLPPSTGPEHPKVLAAMDIAAAMEAWPFRKVPD